MGVDPVAGRLADCRRHALEAVIRDTRGPPARGADDVVVVLRLARDERVLAGREIEAFDKAQVGEEVEQPEHRCAVDTEAVPS